MSLIVFLSKAIRLLSKTIRRQADRHNLRMASSLIPDQATAASRSVARAGLIAFPFLCPLVGGPSVNVWQLLATGACLSALLLAGLTGSPSRWIWLALAVAAAGLLLFDASGISSWIAVCAVLAGMAAAACVGTGMVRGGPLASATLAKGILASGLISAVLGLLQYYGLAAFLSPWATSPGLGQAFGNLRQRNQFATLVSMALVAALWLYANRMSLRARHGLTVAALVLLIAAAASTSRTGLLQLLSIVGVASFIAHRERRDAPPGASGSSFSLPPPLALLAMIPLYFAIAWVLPHFLGSGVEGMLQRLQTRTADVHGRLVLWHNVLTLIAQHPWTGWGWGELSFAHFTTSYPGARFTEILDNAHNLPLHLAVELGIPAAVLICGGFIWMVIAAKPWRERDPTRLMAWGMLGAIVLHSLLEYPLWYGPFQLVFGLCLGILWPARVMGGRLASTSTKPRWRETRALPSLAAAALLAIVAYASWDYLRISQIYLPRDERLPAYADNTLSKLEGSWLFARQVDFAELTLTDVTPANAARMHALAERTLHFSPEPRVIVKLIESAELLGLDGEARAQAERFRIAFPAAFARWLDERQGDAPAP